MAGYGKSVEDPELREPNSANAMDAIEVKLDTLKDTVRTGIEIGTKTNTDLDTLTQSARKLEEGGFQYHTKSKELKRKTWREMIKAKCTFYLLVSVKYRIFCFFLHTICVQFAE